MHPCLNVDEIVRLIARELVASGGGGTAVGLACCRKSFEDPVLDTLWETQQELLPLLKSFPGGVWNDDGCTVSVPTMCVFFSFLDDSTRQSFKRLPTMMEWARFRKYARRMRWLRGYETTDILSLEVFPVMQLCTINKPLLPNLKTLDLWEIEGSFIPFIPLFLSPRITFIVLKFESDSPKAVVASMIATVPTLCPNLQAITLRALPRDPMITAAVSGIPLVANGNTFQTFRVDSPLTQEASEVLYKLPSLRYLSVIVERETSLPSASLPNLIELTITCNNKEDWLRIFHGATFGKLKSVTFYLQSKQPGDFLGAFERAALSSSVQNTLSKFCLSTSYSWNTNYSSLLQFTQMVDLDIRFSCRYGCSSRVDDDIIISLSRAMPKLETLTLGDLPCGQITTGVTTKGLIALARHCPNLYSLRVHFRVASLSDPPAIHGVVPNAGPAASWTDCALEVLCVGKTPMPEGSELVIALTLLRIFPRLDCIVSDDNEDWNEVEDAINRSQ